MRIPRLKIRTLMIVVALVGLLSGSVARWRARQVRLQNLLVEMHAQQQLTDLTIQQMIATFNSGGRKRCSYSSGSFFSQAGWKSELEAFESLNGKNTPLLSIEVSGACDGDSLDPIVITTTGASSEVELVDRLIAAFKARQWRYEFTTKPRSHGKSTLAKAGDD